MKTCARCILPETFPGITFDEEGICRHCRREEHTSQSAHIKKTEYRQRMEDLVSELKGRGQTYDAIMAYSGGKDSSYTLKLLKERYELHILALTFDNHFVSPVAWENIQKVTDSLRIDHISFRPPWPLIKEIISLTARNDIFPKTALLRASAICTACIGLVKSLVLKTALEMGIPLVCFGWSPGQAPIQSAIMKTNPNLVRQSQAVLYKAFPDRERRQLTSYLVPESYYEIYQDRFPHNIHPLAFFDYGETEIKHALHELGWREPSDTDANSTNCLLNAFANQCHIKRHGFHPYAWELANMVRQGIISREAGIGKIMERGKDLDTIEYAQMRLGL